MLRSSVNDLETSRDHGLTGEGRRLLWSEDTSPRSMLRSSAVIARAPTDFARGNARAEA